MKKKHHTKEKGDLGVLHAMSQVASQGFKILTPLSEHLPFDFVAYKDSQFIRIQVKYRTVLNGKIDVHFRSIWSDKNGNHTNPVSKAEFDILCIFSPESGLCYYLNPNKYRSSVTLRMDRPKNGQTKGVHFAHNFRSLSDSLRK